MIFINEWLPNPIGADAKGEFVELFNNGSVPVNLDGWSLGADVKKKFKLSGAIHTNSYLVLPRSETKLALKNTDGKLFLYDAAGKLADQSAFEGSAPEGKSFNRISYDVSPAARAAQQFTWGAPTPGAKNVAAVGMGISAIDYPTNISLTSASLSGISVLGLAFIIGTALAFVLWYSIKKDENIRDIFFRRDEEVWQ
jgi:hypothetical protein